MKIKKLWPATIPNTIFGESNNNSIFDVPATSVQLRDSERYSSILIGGKHNHGTSKNPIELLLWGLGE